MNATNQQLEIIRKLDQYALENYENSGWDYWIETYSMSDKVEAIEEFDNYQDAFNDLNDLFTLLHGHRKEIRSTIDVDVSYYL